MDASDTIVDHTMYFHVLPDVCVQRVLSMLPSIHDKVPPSLFQYSPVDMHARLQRNTH